MSINTDSVNSKSFLHSGELILIKIDNVKLKVKGSTIPSFKGQHVGSLYLTPHRIIFNNNKEACLKSFNFPFVALYKVESVKRIFQHHFIRGIVRAQPNGNFSGEVTFRLDFKSGGSLEFSKAFMKAAVIDQHCTLDSLNWHSNHKKNKGIRSRRPINYLQEVFNRVIYRIKRSY